MEYLFPLFLAVPYGFSSVQSLSHSVVSDSLRPHESQHARPPCLSPTPGVHSPLEPMKTLCYMAKGTLKQSKGFKTGR